MSPVGSHQSFNTMTGTPPTDTMTGPAPTDQDSASASIAAEPRLRSARIYSSILSTQRLQTSGGQAR